MKTKEDIERLKKCSKCWICDNDYIDNNVKVRNHCHIFRKNRGSPHRDCNINHKLPQNFLPYFTTEKTVIPILLCKN